MTKKNVFKGDLIVKNDTVCDYTEVTGSVSVSGSAKLDAPKLETVGGSVSVSGSAKLDALETVGGSVYVYGSAKLDAPKLETVGGYVYVSGSAKLDAPKLKTKNDDTAPPRCRADLELARSDASIKHKCRADAMEKELAAAKERIAELRVQLAVAKRALEFYSVNDIHSVNFDFTDNGKIAKDALAAISAPARDEHGKEGVGGC
jgi:hypothetical protein